MSHIQENLLHLEESIQQTLQACSRKREEVTLVAVSKTFPASVIPEAMQAGQLVFGENKVQEGEEKKQILSDLSFQYHLIGHLQSNKVNKAIRYFDMIHSVDSLDLAKKIHESCSREGKVMPILLQINLSQEEQKSGLVADLSHIQQVVESILPLSGIQLKGFMTIGPMDIDEPKTRTCFQQLREIRDCVNQSFFLSLHELSMGMSHDYIWALEEGSTMLRIGNSIFGKRSYQN